MRTGSNWVVSYNLVSSTRSRSHDKNSTNVWSFHLHNCMLCAETFHYTIPQMTSLQNSRSSLGCFWISSLSMISSLGRISFGYRCKNPLDRPAVIRTSGTRGLRKGTWSRGFQGTNWKIMFSWYDIICLHESVAWPEVTWKGGEIYSS